jgi:hypothetical protein
VATATASTTKQSATFVLNPSYKRQNVHTETRKRGFLITGPGAERIAMRDEDAAPGPRYETHHRLILGIVMKKYAKGII